MDKKDAYNELLKDPRWQKKRLEILNRDEWTCQICGARHKTLHVHHFPYMQVKKPWEYPNRLLVTLCEDCHSQEHEYYECVFSELEQIRFLGVTNLELYYALLGIRFGILRDSYFIYNFRRMERYEEEGWSDIQFIKRLAEHRKNVKENDLDYDLH